MEHRRIATWWITWEDLNWPDHDSMEKVKKRAVGLAQANVNTVMLFGAHFRWDWMPFFPLLHNYIATVVEELHQYNIQVFDHHSVNLVHRYSTQEEMLHVMRDSGPHLPLSPTREAAASWQYKGQYLNDWRQIDVRNGEPLYLPQYTAEAFCHRNPDFRAAYKDYVQYLIAETSIDGLSADDAIYFAHYRACGCVHCRAELKRRAGIDLPPITDRSFWGNWENPAWHHWLDLRREANGDFHRDLRSVLPEGFVLTGCGGSSASGPALCSATDARQFLRGCNYVNLEMSGNMPPYKHDPKTVNVPLSNRLTNASHHQAAAREKGVRAFGTTFAHSTESANIAWSVNKMLDADAWIGTLKARLGLPRHILDTLPEEKDIVGEAFGFEKTHPELFQGNFVGQLGVYFSYETRNHTMFGNLIKGYGKDYNDALTLLFREGICPHTLFDFPKDAADYPVILLSGVARMTEAEKAAAHAYLQAGGKLIATGPCALEGCESKRELPTRVFVPMEEFFAYVPPGESWIRQPAWLSAELPPCNDTDTWRNPREGLFYHPYRIGEKINNKQVVALCRQYMKPMPIKVISAKGYLCTMFEAEDRLTVHLLAEDYDVDIDHKLDSIRFHRSRVNLLTKIEPIGIERTVTFCSATAPTVYTPFSKEPSSVALENGQCTVTLPQKCVYAILQFQKGSHA
ncbi:MAG: hypothetical protein IJP27_03455 [Clostridia bacterium]|nr:hypothetical protein [Clostridia bacterium]